MHHPLPPGGSGGAVRFRKAFLLLLVIGISILFLLMIRRFLLSIFLAAIFAGIAHPLYRWIELRFGGRKGIASIVTILILTIGVGLPLSGFLALVTAEAIQVSQSAGAWLQSQAGLLERYGDMVDRIPFVGRFLPEGDQLLERLRGVLAGAGPAMMGTVAAATRGTLSFFLQLFIVLYALFFFLVDGPRILRQILDYVPLSPSEEEQLLERFVSVTRATLKGSLLIGVIQGGLAGVAFWLAGVPSPAFWGTVMVVLSIIPALGAGLVWVPAVIYLMIAGSYVPALALFIWCVVVVSTIDNFLRPRLVGRDARMSDLLILLSTLGGIVFFGPIGFVVGPIIAALFVTVWHIYGEAFGSWLPDVGGPAGPITTRIQEDGEESSPASSTPLS